VYINVRAGACISIPFIETVLSFFSNQLHNYLFRFLKMVSIDDYSHIDCGLCANILAAKAKKASEPQPPSGKVPSHLVRDETVTWDRWVNIKLNVCFVNADEVPAAMQAKIIEYARYWTQPDAIASIQLEQKPYSRDCHIRVRVTKQLKPGTTGSKDDDWLPNWSLLGTASQKYQINDKDPMAASMELAILDVEDKPNKDGINMFRRRVLHEFGHAFGFDHEQERDDFQQLLKPENRIKNPLTANDAQAATTKPEAPAALSQIQIQAAKVANKSLIRSTVPDRKSVMMYPIRKGTMLKSDDSIPWNDNLSAEDKSFSNKIYPPVGAAVPA